MTELDEAVDVASLLEENRRLRDLVERDELDAAQRLADVKRRNIFPE